MFGKSVSVLLGSLLLAACAGNRPVETVAVTVDKPLEATADMLFTQGMLCWSRNPDGWDSWDGRVVRVVGISKNAVSISLMTYNQQRGLGKSVFSMNASRQGERTLVEMYEYPHDCSLLKMECQKNTFSSEVQRWIADDMICSSIDPALH